MELKIIVLIEISQIYKGKHYIFWSSGDLDHIHIYVYIYE